MAWIINWKNRLFNSWSWAVEYFKNGVEHTLLDSGKSAIADRNFETLKSILAKTYHLLVLSDGKTIINGYVITKKSFFPEKIAGADFCSAKEIDDGVLILFGDAVGHGINDSLTAIICMTAFYSSNETDPVLILQKINRVLCATKNKAYAMVIRIQKGEIFYAGRIEEAKLSERHFDTNCPVLGITEDYEFEFKVAKFEIDDVLYLKTDGAFLSDETDDQMEVIIRKEGVLQHAL